MIPMKKVSIPEMTAVPANVGNPRPCSKAMTMPYINPGKNNAAPSAVNTLNASKRTTIRTISYSVRKPSDSTLTFDCPIRALVTIGT